MFIDWDNQTDCEISKGLIESLEKIFCEMLQAMSLPLKSCELIFVNDEVMQKLNCDYRHQDKTTDVLSFPLEAEFSQLLGSVVISLPKAKEAASEFGHSLEEEITLLFIHGILHLAGFDHENDKGEHQAKEEFFINFFGLPSSLITRTQT